MVVLWSCALQRGERLSVTQRLWSARSLANQISWVVLPLRLITSVPLSKPTTGQCGIILFFAALYFHPQRLGRVRSLIPPFQRSIPPFHSSGVDAALVVGWGCGPGRRVTARIHGQEGWERPRVFFIPFNFIPLSYYMAPLCIYA